MKSYEEKQAETERLLAMLPDVREVLMRIPGVMKVTVGMRERGGKLEHEILFRVHVAEKLPLASLAPTEVVPDSIRGVPIDVIKLRKPNLETGFKDDANDTKKYRPLCGGISVSADRESPHLNGTLGCICRRTTDNKTVLLSNWHVLVKPDGAIGRVAGQPTYRKKCCCVCDRVGLVLDFDQALDCAIAEIDAKISWAPKIRRIYALDNSVEEEGTITGGDKPVAADAVFKVGSTTGLTYGWISDIDLATPQVEITPDPEFTRMSAPGDSGSAYVSLTTRKVVVLHNKGDGEHGFGIPFDLVMAKLKIEVIPTPDDRSFEVAEAVIDGADPAYALSGEVTPEEIFDHIAARLRVSNGGRVLLRIIETHREEIMELINTRRRVSVTWHRSEGPAFLAAFLRSAQDDVYRMPGEIRGISRRDAVEYMAQALLNAGGDALRADIDTFGATICEALITHDSVADLLASVEAGEASVREVIAYG